MTGSEYTLSEKPTLDALAALGYAILSPATNAEERESLNAVLLRDRVIAAVQRINDVTEEVARQVYVDLAAIGDNETWIKVLRGDYSRNVPGQATKKTIHVIEFEEQTGAVV